MQIDFLKRNYSIKLYMLVVVLSETKKYVSSAHIPKCYDPSLDIGLWHAAWQFFSITLIII